MSITQRLNKINNNNDNNNINDTTTNKKNKQISKNQHNNGRGEFIKTSGPAIQRLSLTVVHIAMQNHTATISSLHM